MEAGDLLLDPPGHCVPRVSWDLPLRTVGLSHIGLSERRPGRRRQSQLDSYFHTLAQFRGDSVDPEL